MESFGARLKREREQRKVGLEDISVSTKIGTRFLRALEEEQFDQLPGGIFNKGFVRAYARHLGIDEAQAVADYLAASGTQEPELKLEQLPGVEARELATQERSASAQVPWGLLAIVLLIVAFGFAIWGSYNRESQRKYKPVTPPGRQLAGASETFSVVVTAREDSWVTITADGQQIMQEMMVAPAEKSVSAQKEIVVKAGNVGALEFSFNGKKLPAQGDYDEVKILTFSANGLQAAAAKGPSPSNETGPIPQ